MSIIPQFSPLHNYDHFQGYSQGVASFDDVHAEMRRELEIALNYAICDGSTIVIERIQKALSLLPVVDDPLELAEALR